MASMLPSSVCRAAIAMLAAVLWSVGSAGPASAEIVTKTTGDVADWDVTDSHGKPGGRCRYEGAAGSWFLRSILGRQVEITGNASQHQSVGYRLLLQHRTPNGWKTTQRGTLITAPASQSDPAVLRRTRILRDPDKSPNKGDYRLAIKVIWFDQNAQIEGVQVAYMRWHRRSSDDSVGPSCRGRLPILM